MWAPLNNIVNIKNYSSIIIYIMNTFYVLNRFYFLRCIYIYPNLTTQTLSKHHHVCTNLVLKNHYKICIYMAAMTHLITYTSNSLFIFFIECDSFFTVVSFNLYPIFCNWWLKTHYVFFCNFKNVHLDDICLVRYRTIVFQKI